MSVTAVIVTRGDVPIAPIIEEFPIAWEVLIWDNGAGELARRRSNEVVWETIGEDLPDVAVYGRYAAADCAEHDLIYVQDDDCIVSDPTTIVAALPDSETIVCNMPLEFRHAFYDDHALVGFGCAFHRDLPRIAFAKIDYRESPSPTGEEVWGRATINGKKWTFPDRGVFLRACDIVFTGLTPRVLVDVPVRSLDYASDPNRMWKQPTHQSERSKVLEIVKGIAR